MWTPLCHLRSGFVHPRALHYSSSATAAAAAGAAAAGEGSAGGGRRRTTMWGAGPNWRKLTFFEKVAVEPAEALLTTPAEQQEAAAGSSGLSSSRSSELVASCCGRGLACLGFSDGSVRICGRALLPVVSFSAHSGPCLFLHHLKRRAWLLTLGLDEGKHGLVTTLKVWDMEKLQLHKQQSQQQAEGALVPPPSCLRSIKVFTESKKSKAAPVGSASQDPQVHSFDVLEEESAQVLTSPLVCALGLDDGNVQLHRGDFVRSSRQNVTKYAFGAEEGAVSAVKLHLDGEGLLNLFATTLEGTRNVQVDRNSQISLLDEHGAQR